MYPRILHIYGPICIQSYGFMIAIGMLVFMYFSYTNPIRCTLMSSNLYYSMICVALLLGFIGGRFFVIFTQWQLFKDNPLEIMYPWIGGFGILGAIMSIIVGLPLYFWYNNISILKASDLVALYAPLLQAFARVGCFLAGCCYGSVAPNLWWAVTYSHQACLAPLNTPLHPTQLYMSLCSLSIFGILFIAKKRVFAYQGQLFTAYVFFESLARFVVEWWRGDHIILKKIITKRPEMQIFTIAQLLAIFLMFSALAGWFIITFLIARRYKNNDSL